MTGAEIVMAVAVVTGPIAAVLIARGLEKRAVVRARDLGERRVQRERRMDIFRTLMRTRTGSARLSADHVAALNLIEVEFRNDSDVLEAWQKYFEILCRQPFDLDAMQKSLARLLQVMSKTLGDEIEGLDVFEGGYTPQYWDTSQSDADWQLIRQYVIALSHGKKVLPVEVLESIPGGLLTPPQDR